VIFDNDGVFVDSEHHATRITAALLTELGLPTTPEDCFAQFLGASLDGGELESLTRNSVHTRFVNPSPTACRSKR
jgi:beta-phosphoglucomutase-like phosphatase (HAD superfamily)